MELVLFEEKYYRKVIFGDFFILKDVFQETTLSNDHCMEYHAEDPLLFDSSFVFEDVNIEDVKFPLLLSQGCTLYNSLKEVIRTKKIDLNVIVNNETVLTKLHSCPRDVLYFLLDAGAVPDSNYFKMCFWILGTGLKGVYQFSTIDRKLVLKLLRKYPIDELTFFYYLSRIHDDGIFNCIIQKNQLDYNYISEKKETFISASLLNNCNHLDFILRKSSSVINVYDIYGKNPILICLSKRYDPSILEKLLKAGADPNSTSQDYYRRHCLDYSEDSLLEKYGSNYKLSLSYYDNLKKIFEEYIDDKTLDMIRVRFNEYLRSCVCKKAKERQFEQLVFINVCKKSSFPDDLIRYISEYF